MEPQRYLRCLGQPALFTAAGEPIRFRTRKHLALLVYLAVEQRTQRRDRLAELLWPRVSATEARHSLATALSVLRPRVGIDALETSRDQARLLPGRVTLDLERLRVGDILGTEVSGPLEVAAFLDGFDINDSAEFTHWKDQQQARLLPIIKDAMLVLIDRCRRTGDTRQIEQVADRMLALDELSEEAIRAKMEARAFAGDRLTALEIFEAWKKKLADELQAVPSELVEGIAVRLRRRGWERTTLAHVPNVPTDQWRDRPFIGRNAEYQRLYEMWEATRSGSPSHALILGDSGVGKTTLVQRLTTAAGLEGAAISRVQGYEIEREIPYSTLTGLIIGLLDRSGISATSPEALAELSRMVPQIRQRFPGLAEPSQAQGEAARIRLTESVLEMLTVIADEHPLIMVVDDLDLADDISLAVLHLIMRRAREQPIMVVFIGRPGELAQSSQALRLRESASSLGMTEIQVQPLGEDDSRLIIRSLLSHEELQPDKTAERAIIRAGAGFPMVLELLTQDWRISREQSLALTMDAMTAELQPSGSAQGSYFHIMARITRSLDAMTQNVLNLAALLGNRLNDLGMYTLVDLTVGQTMISMAVLVQRRVLRDGPLGLEFVNELIRAAAYLAIPATLRRALHSKIADRLIEEQVHENDDVGLAVAWHCMRGGRAQEATGYLLRGAREAVNKGAVHAAERALKSALTHLGPSDRGEAQLLLSEVLQEQGRWRESLELLHSLGADQPPLAQVLSVMAEHGSTFLSADQIRRRLALLRPIIEADPDLRIRIKAANVGSILTSSLRDGEAAKALLRWIVDIPSTGLSVDDLGCLAHIKAKLIYTASERPPDLQEITKLAAQLRARGHISSTIGNLHVGIGAVACCEGRYKDAKSEFLTAHQIYSKLGNDSLSTRQAAQLGLCSFRLGEYEEAIDWSLRAAPSPSEEFRGYIECQIALVSGASYALLGQKGNAQSVIQQVDITLSSNAPNWIHQAWGLHKADILLLLDEHDKALSLAAGALGPGSGTLHSAFFAGPFARWKALTCMHSEEEGYAQERLIGMIAQLETYDAIDQVEILCARRLLAPTHQLQMDDWLALIRTKLNDLPPAVCEQLSRLRMFPTQTAAALEHASSTDFRLFVSKGAS